jgi:hypothetical protein
MAESDKMHVSRTSATTIYSGSLPYPLSVASLILSPILSSALLSPSLISLSLALLGVQVLSLILSPCPVLLARENIPTLGSVMNL